MSDHTPLVIDMVVVMIRIGLILERRRRLLSLRYPRLSATGSGKRTAVEVALARHKDSFMADQRGAVAFETLIVYLFMVTSLLLPLADVAAAGFQFISAWEALRAFGQYVQYHSPPDVTNTSGWTSTLPTTVAGYPISNVQVLCGDANAVCSSTNVTLPTKYYSYTTTVTLSPFNFLKPVLCRSSNANPCSFTLPHSERFQ